MFQIAPIHKNVFKKKLAVAIFNIKNSRFKKMKLADMYLRLKYVYMLNEFQNIC